MMTLLFLPVTSHTTSYSLSPATARSANRNTHTRSNFTGTNASTKTLSLKISFARTPNDNRSRFFVCIVCVVLDVASPRGTKATRAKSGCELHCTTNFSLSSFIKCIVSVCGSNCMQLITFSGNLERMDAMDATSAVKSKFGGRCFSGFPVV